MEQKEGPAQSPGQALVTTTSVKPPIKVLAAQASGPTSSTGVGGGVQMPETRGTAILQPEKYVTDDRAR